MSVENATTAPREVTGDGTDVRSRARARWRSWRWPLGTIATVIIVAVLLTLITPRRSDVPLDVRNVGDDGARAVTQVLGHHGVDVSTTTSAPDAARRAGPGTTLAVVGAAPLDDTALDALLRTRADIVLIGAADATVEQLTHHRVTRSSTGSVAAVPLDAGCADPDAVAAASIAVSGSTYIAGDGSLGCFPVPGTSSAAVVTVILDDGRRIDVLGSTDLVTNSTVTRAGNAALALRTLGRHDNLVWFLPHTSRVDDDTVSAPSLFDLLPGSARSLTLLAALVVAAAVAWRARRLGPVVPEELPVEVRAVESTYGRGRLYRRASARGHAAAALRAGAADRMARRVGVARSADGPTLVDALARATGRDATEVAHLLHGPPPTDDAAFAVLIHQLDQLEREVDRS